MILLIEDDQPTAKALQKLLRLAQHEVLVVHTLAAARALLGVRSFKLILSDLLLPDGNAIDLMRELRDRKPCPAIALTGSVHLSTYQGDCLAAGFDVCLEKPVTFDELTKCIERLNPRAILPLDGSDADPRSV